jgi:lipoprotein NlpI
MRVITVMVLALALGPTGVAPAFAAGAATTANTTTPPATAPAGGATPLLAYASEQHFPVSDEAAASYPLKQRLAKLTFDLSKDPPPEADCAQTLGAKRFSTMFDDLGGTYSALGDDESAASAFISAIGCNPRADFLHAELSSVLLRLGKYEQARGEAERHLSHGPSNFTTYTLLVQLDFIDERWPDAMSHARLAVTEAPDDEQATYWQCFLWLAQKYAGTAEPVLTTHRVADNWPRPILESLRGRISEAELVDAVKDERDTNRRREILSEALFYTGQKARAAHHADEAQRYFAATVNLKVTYFIEHELALAELAKARTPSSPADSRSPNIGAANGQLPPRPLRTR